MISEAQMFCLSQVVCQGFRRPIPARLCHLCYLWQERVSEHSGCWSFLCSSCQFKRLPKHIRRSCYCFSSLWYILSFFSWKNKKWNLLTIFFPKLKLLWMSAGTNQCRCILFPEVQVSYCISQRYMYYITKVEVMMEPIHRENLASFEVNASPVIKVIHRILLNFWQGHWCYT